MKNGHIRLGNPGDLRDYLLVDPKQYQKAPANQMAAKLGGGAGSYDDLAAWQGWIQENWQAGVGKKDTADEGFLYAELETRFKGQLCLSSYWDIEYLGFTSGGYTKIQQAPVDFDTVLTVGAQQSVVKIAFKTTPNASATYSAGIITLLQKSTSTNITINIYTDTGGNPNAGSLVSTSTTNLHGNTKNYDHCFHGAGLSGTFSGDHWVVIEAQSGASASFNLPVHDHGSAAATRKTYNGSTWSNSAYSPYYVFDNSDNSYGNNCTSVVLYDNKPYFLRNGGTWFGYYTTADGIKRAVALGGFPSKMIAFGDLLFLYTGAVLNSHSYDGSTLTNLGNSFASVMATWNGYLYKGIENDLYYTADGTTWTGPIQIGPDGYAITGIAGLERDVYVATTEALYRIAEFDQVFGVTKFNSVSALNGIGMIHHQGAIYIPTVNDLLRFGGAEFMSIGIQKEEGLPEYRQGAIRTMCSHNYWLIAAVTPNLSLASGQADTIWAWNDQGWHFVGKMAENETINALCWDSDNNFLWVGSDIFVRRYGLPTNNPNPYKDDSANANFFPVGHIETPWFYGGLKELQKDVESVYISGENFSSGRRYAHVYWMDDDSTAWELLGTISSNRQELRFDDYDTRPNTRQIRLMVQMYTDDYTESPRIDVIRLKYMTMVHDRFRWQLPVVVSDEQQMLDGDLNIHTASQMRTHIDDMVNSVPPVIFEDLGGLQYEVKVLSAVENVQEYRYEDAAHKIVWVYSLSLEQVAAGTYG